MKAKALLSSFASSQLNYCTIILVFYSRKVKIRLENNHKRTLRPAFNKYERAYKYLLEDHDEISIH